MHLSLPTPTLLLLIPLLQTLSFASPAPAPAPAPAPVPVLGAATNAPLTIPNFSTGAALQVASGDTRIYYQTNDGAIHELAGIGSPDSSRVYTDGTLLPAGQARKGTPLAVTDLGLNFSIRLYYISPTNQLKEYYYDNGWKDGDLNKLNILTKPNSQTLWAISVPNSYKPRVGYVAPNGYLSEVAFDGTKWNKYTY